VSVMQDKRWVAIMACSFSVAVAGAVSLLVVSLPACGRVLPPDQEANAANAEVIRTALDAGGGGGPAAVVEQLADPTGFANLTGTFKISGAPPARTALPISGDDRNVCAPGGKTILDEKLVVGPQGGIANVLVYLTTKIPLDNPQWVHPSYDAQKNAVVEFDQKECLFLSHVFAMQSTQKLRILNSDPVAHNTKLSPPGGRGDNPIVPSKSAYNYNEPGVELRSPFEVSCSIHPWMSAWMIFRDAPYFAVSKPDGSFSIQNVPAGVDLKFRVWQEKAQSLSSASVNGQPQSWSKGEFTIKLNAGETRNLDVVLDAASLK
jgi:hypothetical protein